MEFVTRFAPSPTGYLHIGNVRTALIAYAYARKMGGKFILRMDDTDLERSKPEFEAAIKEDLTWLGMGWDAYFRQSDRLALYEATKNKLIEIGRLYPCYETAQELELKRKIRLNQGLPPIYDRSALKLTEAEKAAKEAAGIKPHYRFLIAESKIEWIDEVRGSIHFESANLADPIVIRENGSMTYMLTSVVDDIDMGVTHIIRGEDHISNTAIQLQMFEVLGAKLPHFAHLSLVKTQEAKISKREGGNDIRSLRNQGFEPMALLSLLGKLGSSQSIEPRSKLADLVADFDISTYSKAPATYNPDDLVRLNQKLVSQMTFEDVKGRAKIDQTFWEAIKHNISNISEVDSWVEILNHSHTPKPEDVELLTKAAECLPAEECTVDTYGKWMDALKQKTDRKGKELFMPLRLALTGKENGPELKAILPILGREKVLERLNG